jgi:hypothetical protein
MASFPDTKHASALSDDFSEQPKVDLGLGLILSKYVGRRANLWVHQNLALQSIDSGQ